MKFTITHRNKKNQLLVSTKSLERFLGRIVNDDARNTVENFREYVPYLMNGYDGYKDMPTWMHVHPAAEFQKSENGLLKMKKNNGVLLLTFVDINEDGGVDAIKQKVASLPSTLAAFVGADASVCMFWRNMRWQRGRYLMRRLQPTGFTSRPS